MQKLSNFITRFLSDYGISFSLFFVMLELIGINAYSIHYVLQAQNASLFNWVPASIGAVAYSITTVVVMQQNGHAKLKTTLPVLDAFLVLFGMNIMFIEQYHTNELNYVAVLLSLLFAVFTAVITYSLGQMQNETNKTESVPKTDYMRVVSQLAFSENANTALKTDITELENTINAYAQNHKQNVAMFESMKTDIALLQTDNEKYKSYYLKSELSRLRKKLPENRTQDEINFLNQYQHENSV